MTESHDDAALALHLHSYTNSSGSLVLLEMLRDGGYEVPRRKGMFKRRQMLERYDEELGLCYADDAGCWRLTQRGKRVARLLKQLEKERERRQATPEFQARRRKAFEREMLKLKQRKQAERRARA